MQAEVYIVIVAQIVIIALIWLCMQVKECIIEHIALIANIALFVLTLCMQVKEWRTANFESIIVHIALIANIALFVLTKYYIAASVVSIFIFVSTICISLFGVAVFCSQPPRGLHD